MAAISDGMRVDVFDHADKNRVDFNLAILSFTFLPRYSRYVYGANWTVHDTYCSLLANVPLSSPFLPTVNFIVIPSPKRKVNTVPSSCANGRVRSHQQIVYLEIYVVRDIFT